MAQDIQIVKETFEKAEEILVLLPQNPGPDSIASALALHLVLKNNGKNSFIACGTPLDFTEYPLRQAQEITQKIGNKNLVISLKISNRDSVDKVSYNLDEDNKIFNLVISPKKGANPLSNEAVTYSLAGARADLIVIVGASSYEDLGSLYAAEPGLFNDTPSIAINRLDVAPFATYHLNNPQTSSIAEYMVTLLNDLGLTFNQDSATNLLAGIDVVTDKLQLMNATANTFESVAKLMRAGGQRVMLQLPQSAPQEPAPQAPAPVIAGESQQEVTESQDIPKDWLEPKIYQAPKSQGK